MIHDTHLTHLCRLAELRERIARTRLLLDLANRAGDDAIADLLTFARVVGDETEADSVAAFRAAQTDLLQAAQAKLDLLTGPDER